VNQGICDQGCFLWGETYTVFQRITYLVNEQSYTVERAGYEIDNQCGTQCMPVTTTTTGTTTTRGQSEEGVCDAAYNGVDSRSMDEIRADRPGPIANYPSFTLKWSDEFNRSGNSRGDIDRSVWEVERHPYRKFNDEWQQYVDDENHVYEMCGALTIKATGRDQTFTSGRVSSNRIGSQTTDDPFRNQRNGALFKYGFLEARVSFDNYAKGVWPAFWMLGEDLPTNSWPTCGEIDIMENARNWGPAPNNHNSASLHYPGRFGGNPEHPKFYEGDRAGQEGMFVEVPGGNIREWHSYGLLWDETYMEWFIDGQTMGRLNTPQTYKDRDFFFILNLAVGGILGNNNGAGAEPGAYDEPWGQRMFVDYVRVWQK
jgi:beta-glucanase (GH16 family)